jgi:AraC-like DNA-binding protein
VDSAGRVPIPNHALSKSPRSLHEAADQVIARLEPLPQEVRGLIRVGFRPKQPVDVETAAGGLGVSHRSLTRHLHQAGLVPATDLLRVCRLLVAAFLLIFERATVARAADGAGVGRAATLRYHMKAHFRRLPSALRVGGTAAWRDLLRQLPRLCRRGTLVALACAGLGREARAQAAEGGAVIAGRVTDAVSGAPLAGATVALEGGALTATSGADGRYRLAGAPPGPAVLRVVRIGYAPVRRPLTVPVSGTVTVDVGLARSALNLPNLVVTADPAGRARGELGTASVIGSDAIRNQTAASLAGVLELVPGTTLQPPGLDGVQQFSLRSVPISTGGGATGPNALGPSAQSLASFGTQIVLDGVPLSNNANLQSLGARGELGFASAAGGGIDLRRIPAATLERVEVIRGVPSARFGDLTQGVVLVDTRAGVVPPEARLRFDARTVEGTLLGGARLFPGQTGTASVNLARTRLAPGTRDDVGSRISGQLAHRFASDRLTLDTRIDAFQVLEDEPATPVFPDVAARSRDNGLRVSERARYRLGRSSGLE